MALSRTAKRYQPTSVQLLEIMSSKTIEMLVQSIANTLHHAVKQSASVTIEGRSGFVSLSQIYQQVVYDCSLPFEQTKKLFPEAQQAGVSAGLYATFEIGGVTYLRESPSCPRCQF